MEHYIELKNVIKELIWHGKLAQFVQGVIKTLQDGHNGVMRDVEENPKAQTNNTHPTIHILINHPHSDKDVLHVHSVTEIPETSRCNIFFSN